MSRTRFPRGPGGLSTSTVDPSPPTPTLLSLLHLLVAPGKDFSKIQKIQRSAHHRPRQQHLQMALRGLQLFLLSSALALHSSAQSDAQSSLDATSDGSGSAPYRSSPSFLLFAIQSIVLGVFLLSWGKRSWKVGTALGLGLAFELVTWVAIVNTVGAEGFSASSRNAADLILWGAVTAVGVFGAVLGATKLFWMLGTVAMAGCGGMAFSLSVIMMGDNDLPGIAR